MKRELPPSKQLSEREVESFLNEDPQLSQNGAIQWFRTGIWRWESSDGLTFATSDGHTIEKARTARGVAVDGAARAE